MVPEVWGECQRASGRALLLSLDRDVVHRSRFALAKFTQARPGVDGVREVRGRGQSLHHSLLGTHWSTAAQAAATNGAAKCQARLT